MSILKRILGYILPRDKSDNCGYGPFSLPENHPFTPACRLHDYAFDHASDPESRLSQADWDLFFRWVLIAKAKEDPMDRCHLAQEICRYWPIARVVGREMWNR